MPVSLVSETATIWLPGRAGLQTAEEKGAERGFPHFEVGVGWSNRGLPTCAR